MSDFRDGGVAANVPMHTSGRRPRTPVQGRSQERIARVLAAAERLLVEVGPEKTSIPDVASVADVPRSSIYPYFADKYALFAHLSELQMQRMTDHVLSIYRREQRDDWQAFARELIRISADHYNAYPIAGILLLHGPFAKSDREAHRVKNAALGQWIRAQLQVGGCFMALPEVPDAATIAVEIAFACMKHGYESEGRVSEAICEHASLAAIGYLTAWA